MIKLALRSALSDRAADGKVIVVDDWGFDAPRTKGAVAALAALGLEGRVLVVLVPRRRRRAWKSFRNLPNVHLLEAGRAQHLRRAGERLRRVHRRALQTCRPVAPVADRATRRTDAKVKDPRDVIIEPVVSEKSLRPARQNVYTFVVAPDACKPEIRDAVEAIFDVAVLKVNTLNRKGKRKRNRRTGTFGSRPDTKRAIVTLAEGDRIDLFEG